MTIESAIDLVSRLQTADDELNEALDLVLEFAEYANRIKPHKTYLRKCSNCERYSLTEYDYCPFCGVVFEEA